MGGCCVAVGGQFSAVGPREGGAAETHHGAGEGLRALPRHDSGGTATPAPAPSPAQSEYASTSHYVMAIESNSTDI